VPKTRFCFEASSSQEPKSPILKIYIIDTTDAEEDEDELSASTLQPRSKIIPASKAKGKGKEKGKEKGKLRGGN